MRSDFYQTKPFRDAAETVLGAMGTKTWVAWRGEGQMGLFLSFGPHAIWTTSNHVLSLI